MCILKMKENQPKTSENQNLRNDPTAGYTYVYLGWILHVHRYRLVDHHGGSGFASQEGVGNTLETWLKTRANAQTAGGERRILVAAAGGGTQQHNSSKRGERGRRWCCLSTMEQPQLGEENWRKLIRNPQLDNLQSRSGPCPRGC